MSTVGTSPTLGGLVDLDVLDDEIAGVETLGVGVGLSVLEEVKEELGGLDGPAGLGDTERLACRQSYCQQCEVPEKLGRITHDSRGLRSEKSKIHQFTSLIFHKDNGGSPTDCCIQSIHSI